MLFQKSRSSLEILDMTSLGGNANITLKTSETQVWFAGTFLPSPPKCSATFLCV